MNSLEARRIYGCRVLEHVDDAVRALVSLELAFDDQSCLTLGCAADGRSLRADPQPLGWSAVPERGHIEIHSSHEVCGILRPGSMLTEERLLVDVGQHTIGVALATRHDAVYVFNWCGALRCARDMPRELSAVLEGQPPT